MAGDDSMRGSEGLNAEIKTPWGSIGGKNMAVNTAATVLILIVTSLIAYGLYVHDQNSKETANAFVGALKEQTVAMREGTSVAREQNCLLKFSPEQRQANAEFCKQIT